MYRKKPPFEYVQPKEEQMIDTIIKKKNITDKTIIRLWEKLKKIDEDVKKYDNRSRAFVEGEDEKKETDLTTSSSVDIRLENLTLIKKFKIDEVIYKMFIDEDGVQQVEDYEDETTKHLKAALKSGKDPRTIIIEQEQILNQRVKSYLKFAERVSNMFQSIDEMAEQNKKGEALQEFYTPDDVADELMSYSNILTNVDEDTHLRILEPTAGGGALLNAIMRARNKAGMNRGYTIEAVEFNPASWEILNTLSQESEGIVVMQEQRDFLKYVSNEQYDMIVMNPPFHLKKRFSGLKADMWDGDFVSRAYTLLKTGGEMLIIATDKMGTDSHNTMRRAKKKGLKKFADFDLKNFTNPNSKEVDVVKEYKNKTWRPGGDRGNEVLKLTFTMYRITKPGGNNVEERKAKTKERKKEEKKEEKNERKKIEDEFINTLSTLNAPRRR
jgi:predicted RNA methylase